ncbi:NrsF family protein [Sphingomonas oryzagri]
MSNDALILELATGLALLAGLSCAVATRSFAPPASPRRGMRITFVMSGMVMIAGLVVASSADGAQPLLDRLSPAHGMLCAAAIIVLSMPMMGALAVLMRRAAPANPRQSALAAGFSASTCGALVFTICCPMNDPLYIMVWYSAGVAVVTAVARWLLPKRFRL